jgi:TetR/AcrR family transcriptional repressor of nem operon
MPMANAKQHVTPQLTAKGRATRARIVERAADIMFERGVAGTSLDDVKAVTAVSSSQLYHYFADKSELVSAVIVHQVDAVLRGQQLHLVQLDSMAALRTWRDQLVRIRRGLRCQGGCPLGSLGSELAESDEALRGEVASGFRRWEASIRDGLRAMHQRGELRADADPDALAIAILASVQGGILLSQVYRKTAPLEVALDAALDHVATFLTRRAKVRKRPTSNATTRQ